MQNHKTGLSFFKANFFVPILAAFLVLSMPFTTSFAVSNQINLPVKGELELESGRPGPFGLSALPEKRIRLASLDSLNVGLADLKIAAPSLKAEPLKVAKGLYLSFDSSIKSSIIQADETKLVVNFSGMGLETSDAINLLAETSDEFQECCGGHDNSAGWVSGSKYDNSSGKNFTVDGVDGIGILGTSTVSCKYHSGCYSCHFNYYCNPYGYTYDDCTPSCSKMLYNCDWGVVYNNRYYCYVNGACYSTAPENCYGQCEADFKKSCKCGCIDPYPNECGDNCWGDCNDPDFPHWNCKGDGTATCCADGYPYYCDRTGNCWKESWHCDDAIYCGGSWRVCTNPDYVENCYNGQVHCCPSSKPHYCGLTGSCVEDSSHCCVDGCSPSGSTRCYDSSNQETCGDYDSDACLEWGNRKYCANGCSGGSCITCKADGEACSMPGSSTTECCSGKCGFSGLCVSCTDECDPAGYPACSGNVAYECLLTGDDCYDLLGTNCLYGCSNGACVTTTTVHGYLKDEDNHELASVTVNLTDCNDNHVASDVTDSAGYFSISANAGNYKLKIGMPFGTLVMEDQNGSTCLAFGGDMNLGTINVRTRFAVSGTVENEYGSPVQGATAKLTDCSDNETASAVTGSGGSFTLEALYGEYKLKIVYNSVTYTVLFGGEECNYHAPGDYQLTDPVNIYADTHLSGTVVDEFGDPLEDVTVKFADCSDNFVTSDTTDHNGNFTLVASPGNYKLLLVYDSKEYIVTIGGDECYYHGAGEWQLPESIELRTKTHLSGVVEDEYGEGRQGLTVQFTDCGDNFVASALTGSDGSFELVADPGNYKVKILTNFGTLLLIIDNEECNYYERGQVAFGQPITIPVHAHIHGHSSDLGGNPIEGMVVELYDCYDNFVTSDTTDSSGYFSLTADSGKYKLKVLIGQERFLLEDSNGNSCFLFMGDIPLDITIGVDCSQYDYECYYGNWKLFNCFFDPNDPACVCYYDVCQHGCTPGEPECDVLKGNIHVDVDDMNNYYNPLRGAKIYLDYEYIGVTDSLGKKTLAAEYGYRNLKVSCPDDSYCDEKQVYVDGDEYVYFDCVYAAEQTGDILIELAVISDDTYHGSDYLYVDGRPVSNSYVHVDGRHEGLTDLAGQLLLKNIGYGEHDLEFFFCLKEDELQEYCDELKYGSTVLHVNKPQEIKKFGVYSYDLTAQGVNAANGYNLSDNSERNVVTVSNYTGEYSAQFICGGICIGIFVVVSAALIAWDAYNVYDCAQRDSFDFDEFVRWGCWDEVGWLAINFIPIGAILSKLGKGVVIIGKNIRYLPKIGKLAKPVLKHGDDVFKVAVKYGDEVVEYLVKYGDDGTKSVKMVKNAAGVLLKNSDDAAKAVKIVYRQGDDFVKIGDKIIKKGDLIGNIGNIQGELGEIAGREYVTQAAKNADEVIEILVKSGNPGEEIVKNGYKFKFGASGRNIEFTRLSDGLKGEIDTLLEINGKSVVIESKASKLSTFMPDLTQAKLQNKLDAAKAFFDTADAELLFQVPTGQVSAELADILGKVNGKVLQFADNVDDFEKAARVVMNK